MDKDEVIRKALRFPIEPVLKMYMKYFGVSEDEAHEHELELKRYLALSALNKEKRYTTDAPIANLWRTFIVFTLLYTEFCIVVAGGYIHYTPTEARPISKSEMARSSRDFLRDYEAVFKAEAPQHIWPRPTDQLEVIALSDQELSFNGR